MKTITVKISHCKEDGGCIPSINGWIIMGDIAERNNGKTWSKWDRRPATAEESKAVKLTFAAFRNAGYKHGEYTVEI